MIYNIVYDEMQPLQLHGTDAHVTTQRGSTANDPTAARPYRVWRQPMLRMLAMMMLGMLAQVRVIAQSSCTCAAFDAATRNGPVSNTDSFATTLLQSKEKHCRAKGLEQRAKALFLAKKLDTALLTVQQAMSLHQQSGCAESSLLDAYKIAANITENIADFEQTLHYDLKLLAILEQQRNVKDMAFGYLAIAQVFNRMQQYEQALSYCRKAIPIVTALPPNTEKAQLLNRIAARYLLFYNETKQSRGLDSTHLYAQQALTIARLANAAKEKVIAWTRINSVALERKNYATAAVYIDSALAVCQPGADNPQLATLYGDRAQILLNTGRLADAARFADSALRYHKAVQYPPLIANGYQLVYDIAAKAGDYKKGMEALAVARAITDSLAKVNNTRTISELEKKYNQARNEKTIRELAQQKRIWLLLALSAVLLIGMIGFFMRQQSLRHRQKIMETEQRLNRARMNPHFFFNALASLQHFAMNDQDHITMAENLSKFSHIMRETLENSYREYVTLDQEIQFLTEYLALQKIRFPEKFTYDILAGSDLEADELMIPSMILQPFAENSIEHGFAGIDFTGHLRLAFSREQNEVCIAVTDNGTGLNYGAAQKPGHVSRASQIIRDRIYLLNIKLKTKARFNIENNTGGSGVTVTIHLPVLYKEDTET